MTPGRYLLVRLSAIGDVVFALESVAALRNLDPGARIDWLVEDRIRPLLESHPDLDRVLVYPRREFARCAVRPWLWPSLVVLLVRHACALRRTRYDAVLDLHGNLKSGLHVLLARAKRKIGFDKTRAKEGAWLAVRERVTLPSPRPHRSEEGLLLLERLVGATVARPPHPVFPIDEAAKALANAWLDATRPTYATHRPAGMVVLAPGTSAFAAFKRWPARRYAELAERLCLHGLTVVVSTGPGERELGRNAVGQSGAIWFDGAEHGLAVALEVMRQASVCVAADSGPMHLAQAVGVPVVGIFGPKDPLRYGPRLPGSIVMRYATPCAPCGRRACELPTCVQAVTVDDILRATLDVLSRQNRAS
ncbi:MAG: glycosyltransferase family 9 protein [Planctomycetes bacterium]|nr:glycosyltransferase family 9 protein [Planctomycetota bacterium]MCB9890361.1 glycosyltransferase family 9 protein [Planctomycetota bacterium]MCB9918179.1 glycosyltransferase family 9 protein [Planctomycetota bacterium]